MRGFLLLRSLRRSASLRCIESGGYDTENLSDAKLCLGRSALAEPERPIDAVFEVLPDNRSEGTERFGAGLLELGYKIRCSL